MTWIRLDAESARQAAQRIGERAQQMVDLLVRMERIGDTPGLGWAAGEVSATLSSSVSTLISGVKSYLDQLEDLVRRIQQFIDAGAASAALPAVAAPAGIRWPGLMTVGGTGSWYPSPGVGTTSLVGGAPGWGPVASGSGTGSIMTIGGDPGWGASTGGGSFMLIGGPHEESGYIKALRELQIKNPAAAARVIAVTQPIYDLQSAQINQILTPGGRISTSGSPGPDWELTSRQGDYEIYAPRRY